MQSQDYKSESVSVVGNGESVRSLPVWVKPLLRVGLPVLIANILFGLTVFVLLIPMMRENLVEQKREFTREHALIALELLEKLADLSESGAMSEAEAKDAAKTCLKEMRYGREGKDYFWIMDGLGGMVMHPYRPDMDGISLDELSDTNAVGFFNASREVLDAADEGFVEYVWQRYEDRHGIRPKVSFIKRFNRWGWVVGTGMYLDDVMEDVAVMNRVARVVGLVVMMISVALSVLIIYRNIRSESALFHAMKDLENAVDDLRKANQALDESRDEIKTQSDEILKSESRYRDLLGTMNEGVSVIDRDARFVFVSDRVCEMSGYTRDELLGLRLHDVVAEESMSVMLERLSQFPTVDRAPFEMQTLRKDGSTMPCRISPAPMKDDAGNIVGSMAIVTDLTAVKSAEEEVKLRDALLKQADKMVSLGTLVAEVAHEINNPNNFIMLNAPVLKEIYASMSAMLEERYDREGDFMLGKMNYSRARQKLPRLLDGIKEGSQRIAKIVNELRDFAGRQKVSLRKEEDICEIIRSAVAIVEKMIMRSTRSFTLRLPDKPLLVDCNYQEIEQVVINLLQNACQALRDSTESITLEVETIDDAFSVVIRVRDEGMGMSQETLDRITEPFFSTKTEQGGTGLGLFVAVSIVSEHKGALTFSSRQGSGTTATLLLPVRKLAGNDYMDRNPNGKA